jgi:hypothetical protein
LNPWLPLTDYSTKYKVSVSTLRRRIKAEDIKFRFDDGKYFLIDEPMSAHQRTHRPSPDSEYSLVGSHPDFYQNQQAQHLDQRSGQHLDQRSSQQLARENFTARATFGQQMQQPIQTQLQKDEPILTAANKLLNELKKAYSLILQEKEEQILQLKDEVADLKTLVRVLESDNDRMRGFHQ